MTKEDQPCSETPPELNVFCLLGYLDHKDFPTEDSPTSQIEF